MAKVSGIYKIVNNITGTIYVGSSCNILKRWDNHRQGLRKGIHSNPKLQNSWSKHGKEAFSFHIVEEVSDVETLHVAEQRVVTEYKSAGYLLYNIRKVVESSRGLVTSEETKAKLSKASTGKTHTRNTKLKLRQFNTGKRLNADHKDKLRAKALTRSITSETRTKMYATRKVKHLHKQLDRIIKDWST
jgi:group I intron endonuclease